MIKSAERDNPNSRWNRARDDEMVFVLLGRDVAAPAAISAWIRQRIQCNKNTIDDPQIVEADTCVRRMLIGQAFAEYTTGTPEVPSEPIVFDDPIIHTPLLQGEPIPKGIFTKGDLNPDKLLITSDWLLSVGFELPHSDGPLRIRGEKYSVEINNGQVGIRGVKSKNAPFIIGDCATANREKILNLLDALLIPHSLAPRPTTEEIHIMHEVAAIEAGNILKPGM